MLRPESALPDWNRAHGKPLFHGLIKQELSDFEVTERLGFPLSDDGEHDFLWLEKRGANTAWVAGQLARHAGVPSRDVGYAGLKDRHAVTRQWFSVRRPSAAGTDWQSIDIPGVRILEIGRNRRKLKRGSHAGNVFRIVVRGVDCSRAEIDERIARIAEQGVPNYFGPQRFGRDGANLSLARSLFAGKRLSRDRRSVALSAARSFLFNEMLSVRVADGTWNRALPGESLILEGSRSYFHVEAVDMETAKRVSSMDVHPSCALWGERGPDSASPSDVERQIVTQHRDISNGLERFGVAFDRRALRVVVRDLDWDYANGSAILEFALVSGAFATSVLREAIE
jgi:tRNA pseudouridine13 synthase